jgi:hypothetical protein
MPNKMKLEYIGMDSWDRPVYKDENKTLWKDVDPREDLSPSLCTSANNEFDGEPDKPMSAFEKYEQVQIEFIPERVVRSNDRFRYMLLDRMRSDCDYYLGFGNRNLNHLSSNSVEIHIQRMKDLWNSFPDDKKPEWLTYEQILQYETEMCATNEEYRKLQQATDEIAKLKLDSRSLIYSVVEVRTDFGYRCFLLPGICDRDALEDSEQYQELMEDAEDTEVNTSVHSYSVGTGESERPDEAELEIIEQYTDELDEKYGIDPLQSDFISFYYEPEQEY